MNQQCFCSQIERGTALYCDMHGESLASLQASYNSNKIKDNYLIGHAHQWETLKNAIDAWGESDQKAMTIGEIGEYLTLVGRQVQGRITNEEWISEIADVIIMMHQMAAIYGTELVKQEISNKMEKINKKLIAHYKEIE